MRLVLPPPSYVGDLPIGELDDYPKLTKAQRFAFLEEEEETVVAYETKVAELRSARDARLASRRGGSASEATVAM